ncbi:MAG: hypothetical protein HY928_01340 [Elusimicrobia bacterium]|nr:hypothetical protein [Elusimicrobiota bacterium]
MNAAPILLALLALPCRAQSDRYEPPANKSRAELMQEDIRAFEADDKEARALLASILERGEQVSAAADLDALAGQEYQAYSRMAKLVDDIYRRRNRFRVQANALQVGVLAAQVNAGRADRAKYETAAATREATDRMTDSFKTLHDAYNSAHSLFRERLGQERALRRQARNVRWARAAAGAAVLLLPLALLRRGRKPKAPMPAKPPAPHLRPKGPGRLE